LSRDSSNVAPQLNHTEFRNLVASNRFSRQFEKGNLHSQQSPILLRGRTRNSKFMKAIRLHSYGGPEVLQLDDIPVPEPGAGEVLVRVLKAGANFIDVYQRTGLYRTPLPCSLGSEGAGAVEKVGPKTKLQPGTRVAWPSQLGSFAEFMVAPAWKLVPVPENVDDSSAAAALLQGITAQYLSETTYPATKKTVALVHAGAGGTGRLLIQLLKKKGARVFTTVSTDEKANIARESGADETILYTQTDFVQAVKDLTKGKGVHVVYDSVGKSTYEGSMSVLHPLGTLALFGQSSGPVPPIDPLRLTASGSIFLARPSLQHHIADPRSLKTRGTKVLNWVADGSLKLHIEHTYPLADIGQAYRDLEGRRTTGKLLIDVASAGPFEENRAVSDVDKAPQSESWP
jgi:NADPH:quinone reductase